MGLLVNGLTIGSGHDPFQPGQRALDLRNLVALQFATGDLGEIRTTKRLFRGIDDRLGLVPGLDEQTGVEVGLGVLERLDEHALDFLVGQAVRRLDLD